MSKRCDKTDNATAFSNLALLTTNWMLPQSIDALPNSQIKSDDAVASTTSARVSTSRTLSRGNSTFTSSISLKRNAEALNPGAAYYITEQYPKALETFLKPRTRVPTSPMPSTTWATPITCPAISSSAALSRSNQLKPIT